LKQMMQGRHLVLLFFLGVLTLLTSCGGGAPAASWFGIAGGDDAVYLAANEQVFALSVESGTQLWAFPPEPDRETGPFFAIPLLTAESIIVGAFGQNGELLAISRNGGSQNWSVETAAPIVAGAVATDGGIIVGNNEGEVFLVETESQTARLLLNADKPIWASPLVDEANGRIYVASMNHRMYAVDLERNEQVWAFDAGGALVGTPALNDGMLFFGALNSTFYAIDAETADEIWRFETDGWVWGGPLVDGDTVFFGDMSGKLYALNTANGDERWIFEADGGVRVTPLLTNDPSGEDEGSLLYFGTREGTLYALRAEEGIQRWSLPLDGAIYSQPMIHNGLLLVSPHNAKAKLIALDPESGAERWSYPPREE
jgi:outer membrane protein assembly factor BamB